MFTAAVMGCVWQLVIKENDDDDDDDDQTAGYQQKIPWQILDF